MLDDKVYSTIAKIANTIKQYNFFFFRTHKYKDNKIAINYKFLPSNYHFVKNHFSIIESITCFVVICKFLGSTLSLGNTARYRSLLESKTCLKVGSSN